MFGTFGTFETFKGQLILTLCHTVLTELFFCTPQPHLYSNLIHGKKSNYVLFSLYLVLFKSQTLRNVNFLDSTWKQTLGRKDFPKCCPSYPNRVRFHKQFHIVDLFRVLELPACFAVWLDYVANVIGLFCFLLTLFMPFLLLLLLLFVGAS